VNFNIKHIFNAIAYGLAVALLVIILTPSLREKMGLTKFTENVIQPEAMSFAFAVQQAAPSVVNVYSVVNTRNTLGQQQELNDLGSGVLMTSNGHILTNYHVVDNAELIMVLLQDGRQFSAEVIGLDEVTDLALLKIDASNLPAIPQEPDLEAQVGDIVLAIGNPLNLGQTITQGIISATEKKGLANNNSSHTDYIQMDAAINLGSSGGALVNSRGMLVGINTAKAQRDVQGIFFAIPYKLAKHITDLLLADGEVTRGYLGLDGFAINQAGVAVRSSVESIAGIKITNVDPFGPAWKGGLRSGDIMLAINGKQLVSFQELLNIIENTKPGNYIQISLSRNREMLNKDVQVGKLEIGN
jgi:serine protease DegS